MKSFLVINRTSKHLLSSISTNVRQFSSINTRPLKGRTALITGSTSGIGLSIAQAFAGQGCSVMINGFGDSHEIERVRAQMKKDHQVEVEYHPADLSKPEQIRSLIATTKEKFGSVDILVNNAGIQHVSPVESFPVERWDAIIAINLSAVFHAVRETIPHMRQNKWGNDLSSVISLHVIS